MDGEARAWNTRRRQKGTVVLSLMRGMWGAPVIEAPRACGLLL